MRKSCRSLRTIPSGISSGFLTLKSQLRSARRSEMKMASLRISVSGRMPDQPGIPCAGNPLAMLALIASTDSPCRKATPTRGVPWPVPSMFWPWQAPQFSS